MMDFKPEDLDLPPEADADADAYLAQESLHKEIDIIQDTMHSLETRRIFVKLSHVLFYAAFLFVSKSTHTPADALFGFITITIALAYLDARLFILIQRYGWLYDWTLINRQLGESTLRYNLSHSRFEGYESEWVHLLDYTCIPFYIITTISFLFAIGVL